MDAHLKGALYAPEGDKYTTVAGSYLTGKEQVFLLLPNESSLDESIRSLIRIGVDHIKGYVSWEELGNAEEAKQHFISTSRSETSSIDLLKRQYPSAKVLDVRSRSEFDEAHIEGAVNIAFTRLMPALESLQNELFIVHCGSGLRASLAVSYLERHNIEVVYVDGSYTDYQRLSHIDAKE